MRKPQFWWSSTKSDNDENILKVTDSWWRMWNLPDWLQQTMWRSSSVFKDRIFQVVQEGVLPVVCQVQISDINEMQQSSSDRPMHLCNCHFSIINAMLLTYLLHLAEGHWSSFWLYTLVTWLENTRYVQHDNILTSKVMRTNQMHN